MSAAAGTAGHAWDVAARIFWIDTKQGLRKHLAVKDRRDRVLKALGLLFGLAFLTVLHICAYALIVYAGAGIKFAQPPVDAVAVLRGLNTAVWGFLLFVMIGGGLVRAIVVLHEQDDGSLLLSSPASARAVLAARLLGNSLQSCLVDGFIIVPWIDVLVFNPNFGHWKYLWGFPVWFALAIVVTCVDGLFSFGLISWLGLRRARLFSQAIPFILIFGVTFFAGSASVSVASMTTGTARMPPAMMAHFAALSHTPLGAISRAALGNPTYLTMLFAFAAALAIITLRATERAFVEGSQHLAEGAGPSAITRADRPFRGGVFWREVRKSQRLILRTPMMLVQCLAQVLTPVGIAFVLARDDLASAVSFFVLFAAGVLGGMLTIAAGTVEECEDLLRMSPQAERRFRWAKIVAGCGWPLAAVLATSLGLLLCGDGMLALGVIAGGVPLTITASLAGETFATPVKPGVRPKLLSDPIMMIPLLAMQITSGAVAGMVVFFAAFSASLLALALGGSYLVFLIALGLAHLRKPLLGT